jgi:hypothetical protein
MAAGLAIGELWFSFTLIAVVSLLVSSGLLATLTATLRLLDATPAGVYSAALATTLAAAAGLIARLLARQRRRGTLGWLVARGMPRPALLAGWLLAVSAVMAVGLSPAGILGWLALASGAMTPASFGAALLAVGSAGLAAFCLAAAAAMLTEPMRAALVTLAACAGLGFLLASAVPASAAGFTLLAGISDSAHPIARSLWAAGVAMALGSMLATMALALLQRADL